MKGSAGRIRNWKNLEKYIPPGHDGTINVRLIEKEFCGAFEMVHGTLQPGGIAKAHAHEIEYQVIYVLEGKCEVSLGGKTPVECGPGTIIEIPPKLTHEVVAKGSVPLKVLVIYCPPLPPRADQPAN